MKVLIQRVLEASVEVDNTCIGEIQQGLLAFVGIEKQDSDETITRMTEKLLAYRIFSDDAGKMNLSVRDIKGGVLAISQFTLAADTRKGLRPSFSSAASPEQAKQLYDKFVNILQSQHPNIAQGRFAADMKVSLVNDGPVTFLLEM